MPGRSRTGLSPDTLLTRTSEDFGPQMGEYCVSRVLAVAQRLRYLESEQQARSWKPKHPRQIRGTRALIVGTGTVGAGIARAFGAGIRRGWSLPGGQAREPFRAVSSIAGFAGAVAGAQWLVLACPLTEETFHLLNRDRLSACGGAYLVNVGRGMLVEEEALPEALDQKWLSGAALDVFEREPLPEESPLWRREDVTISPTSRGSRRCPARRRGFWRCWETWRRANSAIEGGSAERILRAQRRSKGARAQRRKARAPQDRSRGAFTLRLCALAPLRPCALAP